MSFLLDGLLATTWKQLIMYGVGALLIYLAISKKLEPSLLLPMGFGAILVNLPYSGAITQMMTGIGEVEGILDWLFTVGINAAEAMPLLLFIGIGAMIDSMTLDERRNPDIIDRSRRHRIATGSGSNPADVNKLMKQYEESLLE